MWSSESSVLPIYSLSKSDLTMAAHELIESSKSTPKWKYNCEMLLQYLQSHDLSKMPEALHERLYSILTEIVTALGDNLPSKPLAHGLNWPRLKDSQHRFMRSSLFGHSVQSTIVDSVQSDISELSV